MSTSVDWTSGIVSRLVTKNRVRLHGTRFGVLVLVLALLVYANEELKPRLFPKRLGTVVEGKLYRSGRIHSTLLESVLTSRGIDTIITLTSPVEGHAWQASEAKIAESLGIELVRFPLAGNGTGDPSAYTSALGRIYAELQKDHEVLVHCAAGTQRTGGVVFLYRTLILNETPEAAYHDMRGFDFRPDDNPALLPFLWKITPEVIQYLQVSGIRPRAAISAEYRSFFDTHLGRQ